MLAPEAEEMRKRVLALIAEYGSDKANQQKAEKVELGASYDINSYGSGYDAGQQSAANELAEMIADLT